MLKTSDDHLKILSIILYINLNFLVINIIIESNKTNFSVLLSSFVLFCIIIYLTLK